MAVFTDVSPDDARALIAPLSIGTLTGLRGITAGIENTNYFLDTDQGAWVLTLFERLSFTQLPFFLGLTRHLAAAGLPVPAPQARRDNGSLLHTLHGKPCAVVSKLNGAHVMAPTPHHAAQLGGVLARMHLAARSFVPTQPNLRGPSWWHEVAPQLYPYLTLQQRQTVQAELDFQDSVAASAAMQAVPRGPIHADLFRDNVLFEGPPGQEHLTGVFDFYFAGEDSFIFDMAVCINDWCIDQSSGRLNELHAGALVAAYEMVRKLGSHEHRLLPAALRAAALRFWLSRLMDWHLPRDAKMLAAHDPLHFERVLHARIESPWHA